MSSPGRSEPPARIAILATFTADPLAVALRRELHAAGLDAEVRVGPLDQIVQQCLDPASEIAAFRPQILIVFARLEELLSRRAAPPGSARELGQEVHDLAHAVAAPAAWPARILFVLPPMPSARRLGLPDDRQEWLDGVSAEARSHLRAAFGTDPEGICDSEPLVHELGEVVFDDALFALARVPYTEALFVLLARELASRITKMVTERDTLKSPESMPPDPGEARLTLERYLAGLALHVSIFPMGPGDERVVSDLSRVVGDFHLDGRVRTVDEIRQQSDDGARFHLVRVSDRFSDYGVAGAFALERKGDIATVDFFLLTCRVLGKGTERAVLAEMRRLARKDGARTLLLRSSSSPRNKESQTFVRSLSPRSGAPSETLTAQIAVEGDGSLGPIQNERAPGASVAADPMGWAILFRERRSRVETGTASREPSGSTIGTAGTIDATSVTGRQLLDWMTHARSTLRIPRHAASGRKSLENREPRSPLEISLARLWAETLRLPDVGIDDDFFELGGHSLLAVRLLSRIHGALGRTLPLSSILQYPTVALFAEALEVAGKSREGLSGGGLVPLRTGGDRVPLVLIHPAAGQVFLYRHLASCLSAGRPVWGIETRGLHGGQPHESVAEMAEHSVRLLRERAPRGPYVLCGLSFGALVAFEMARLLEADSQDVPLLVILDASAPLRQPSEVEAHGTAHDVRSRDRAGALAEIVGALGHFHGRDLGISASALRTLGEDEQLDEALKRLAPLGFLTPEAGRDQAESLLRVYQAAHIAFENYEIAGSYSGHLALLNAQEHLPETLAPRVHAGDEAAARGWDHVCSNVEAFSVPGDHLTMLDAVHAPGVASLLDRLLARYADHGPTLPLDAQHITDEGALR